MSQISIEVIDVEIGTQLKKNGKGTYEVVAVTYKSVEGKVDQKKLMDWATDKVVLQTFKEAKKGDTFSVEQEKDQAGYWVWISVSRQDGPVGAVAPAGGKAVPAKPTYETPEERAQKQVYIVRQSSLSNAIEYHKLTQQEVSIPDVINTAATFESYVFGTNIKDVTDDIPF